jgi:hypothetical protein
MYLLQLIISFLVSNGPIIRNVSVHTSYGRPKIGLGGIVAFVE